jgi:hypothetical protein
LTWDAVVELVHRVVGYPLAFIVGPIALATFAGAPGHRWSGRAYALAMTFLYVTGTALTLTRHEWGSWAFARNVAFNLLGYSFVLHGWRAMWLQRRWTADGGQFAVVGDRSSAGHRARIDVALFASLLSLTAVLVVLAVMRPNTPVRVFAAIGVGLAILEVRHWRSTPTRADLYRRHVRYVLASYFYVLTVVSLVHLRQELASDARWLWPSAIALAAIWLVDERARATRWTVRAIVALSLAFGAYVAWELVRDDGQVERMLGLAAPALQGSDIVHVEALDLV